MWDVCTCVYMYDICGECVVFHSHSLPHSYSKGDSATAAATPARLLLMIGPCLIAGEVVCRTPSF